ncbi:MAG TPA: SAM-dependent methyltransferase [Burkholderiaceae bacterium]|nr:SAM-dependent methyltransferase [Burkholderiaceae bacterium]HNG78052.1 SAM-dependent methyltransferase [Burkholderiaceae bacterium]
MTARNAPQAVKPAQPGGLWLVPNTLDLGTVAPGQPLPDVREVLPARALQVAARLPHWVVENARSARALLKRIGEVEPLARPLQEIGIRELPRARKGGGAAGGAPALSAADWLAPALAGQDMGLMSEAGLPAVADPGAQLVELAHAVGVPVRPLSGPSSLMLALAASGLNGQSFAFVGYLPTDAAQRLQRLRELEQQSRRWRQTQLVIETPYRNTALLAALREGLQPGTRLCVACGLTLAQEAVWTADVGQWRGHQRPGLPTALPADVPAVFLFLAG